MPFTSTGPQFGKPVSFERTSHLVVVDRRRKVVCKTSISKQEACPNCPTRRAVILYQSAPLAIAWPLRHALAVDNVKKQNLPIEKLRDIIAHDFQTNQYYITGKLTAAVFTDDCIFRDPTTKVQGVQKYSQAVASLFDRDSSQADLISIEVKDAHTIMARWRFAASLKVPGKPRLKPYTGSTTYKLNSQGLVYEHLEDWDISALDAFISILAPSYGAPPAPPVTNPVNI